VLRFSQQTVACEVIICRYLQVFFNQIFPPFIFIIIMLVKIITVYVTNFYIYVTKDFRRYFSSVLPIYRNLNATVISIFGVRDFSYLGRISETRLEVLR
jgi:glucan phosphoethanolaminetransferase (alkaline phosphatase superfamily)